MNIAMQALQLNTAGFRARKGQEQSFTKMAWEVVGIVGFLIVLGLLVAWFFNTMLGSGGCGGMPGTGADDGCMQAKQALAEFSQDVNEACGQGGELSGDEVMDLADGKEYDFGDAHYLALNKDGSFAVGRFADSDFDEVQQAPLGPFDTINDVVIGEKAHDWKHKESAGNCDTVLQYGQGDNLRTDPGDRDWLKQIQGSWDEQGVFFGDGQTTTSFRYLIPEDGEIRLKVGAMNEGSDDDNM